MKKQMFNVSILALVLGALSIMAGCNQQKAGHKDDNAFGAPARDGKASQNDGPKPRVLETVDLTPGKAISPQDQAKISGIAVKILGHVNRAKEGIQTKNIDAAKKELAKAVELLAILKEVLPTTKVIDHIWDIRTGLSYLNTTEVQQDLVTLSASIDQLYDVLPEGKAKEHAKKAKDIVAKDKQKGAAKAKENLDLVEVAIDFREVDLSVSYTSRLVKVAQKDLDQGKTKEASDALTSVADGVLVFDTAMIDPIDVAVRRIWLATQDYAAKDHKAAKTRLEKAKMALDEATNRGDKALQESARKLIGKIEAIDVMKAVGDAEFPLEALWQDARKLVERPRIASTTLPDSKDKTDKEAKLATEIFIRSADQINLTDMKLGKVAEDHATSDAVKKFGGRAVRDHALMNKELREITSKKAVKLAEALDQQHQDALDKLSKLKGSEFDRAYTKDMVSDHEKAIEQFEIEIKKGRDSDVKAWAEKWLPTLREHLKLAREAVKDVK